MKLKRPSILKRSHHKKVAKPDVVDLSPVVEDAPSDPITNEVIVKSGSWIVVVWIIISIGVVWAIHHFAQ